MNKHNRPPLLFQHFLSWFCHEDYFEELQGDLEEKFYERVKSKGISKARWAYRKEVVKLFRPSVFKKIQFRYSNNTNMFKNYTLVAYRNLLRNKLFSTINIIGLAISMAVGLLAITFVSEIRSYDKFHEKADRIYRVFNNRTVVGKEPQAYASTSLLTGIKLKEEATSFDIIVPIYNGFNGNVKKDQNLFKLKGQFVGEDFFKLFSFPLLYGNPETALQEPNTTVLTEEFAMKIFSRKDVVGEVLEWGPYQFTITGVMQQPPGTSHIKFDAVASLKTYEIREDRSRLFNDWSVMWTSYVYVHLNTNASLEQAQADLDRLAEKENAKTEFQQINPGLEALTDIFPGDGKYNQIDTVMPKKNIDQIVILALIVLFSACFNYANLSVARSMKRAKEVGIRKVVGAKKASLFVQFISESIFVSLLALFIAFLLFKLIKPEFISLNLYTERTTTLNLTATNYLYFILFAVLIGVVSGVIPALLMTKLKTVNVLKGISGTRSHKGLNIRKVMIGLQFAFSMTFAILVILIQKQYHQALNFDLGYNTEDVVNITLSGKDTKLLQAEIAKVPGVKTISTSYFVNSTGVLNSDWAKIEENSDSVTIYNNWVNTDYLDNMGHQLLAGVNFDKDGPSDQMIVNEKLIEKYDLKSATEAVGKRVYFYDKYWTIVGVVKDFHYGTVYNELNPFAYLYDTSKEMYYMNVKIETSDILKTMAGMERAWKTVNPKNKFEAEYYSDSIKRMYTDLSSSMKTFGMLAIVAISISVLGLLGMAVFTAESRIKELTIRKVLGANVLNLLTLLSKSFLVIFIIAVVISIPISLQLFKSQIASNIEYQIQIGFWELSSGALLVLIIAFFTIGSQSIKAAKTNPAESLRND